MIGLIITLLVVVLGFYTFRKGNEGLGFTIVILGGIVLLGQIFAIPTNRYEVDTKMLQRKSFIETLKHSRTRGYDLEDAGILHEINRWNMWTVSIQKDNEFWFDTYIPDEVDTLTQLK